ncbi:MAG: hypothetical protein QNJ38_08320 [Prochloraceae cyanobacterium]|nr:hypothetical protein [Prochloraceae cyanobacterium]
MGLVSSIFGKGTKAIGNYLGVIDSLEIKIGKLVNSELDAALRAMKQASISVTETETLLREARSKFNKAVHLEKEERLVSAYLGLALCHYQLGDLDNSKATLTEFSELEINLTVKRKVTSYIVGEYGAIQSDLAESVSKVFSSGKSSISSKIESFSPIKKINLFGRGVEKRINSYCKKVADSGQDLMDKNYYHYLKIEDEIKIMQAEAKEMSLNLTAFKTGEIKEINSSNINLLPNINH